MNGGHLARRRGLSDPPDTKESMKMPGELLVSLDAMLMSIASGDHDSSLVQIAEIVHERRKQKRKQDQMQALVRLKAGDRIRMVATASPKYIAGKPGTIVERKGAKFVVDLDEPAGRFHKGVRCPADLIEAM